jgi:hypothetical protein
MPRDVHVPHASDDAFLAYGHSFTARPVWLVPRHGDPDKSRAVPVGNDSDLSKPTWRDTETQYTTLSA